MVTELVALILLFRPASSKWFKDLKALRKKDRLKGVSASRSEHGLEVAEEPEKNWWHRILASLRNTDQPLFSYIWRAWLIALIPSLAMSIIVSFVMPDKLPKFEGPLAGTVVLLALVGPWFETFLMWPILWVLKKTVRKTLWVAAVSAVIWGIVHSLGAAAHGLTTAWPFFVFSLCFLQWQQKSTGRAITTTALLHMCHNTLPALCLVLVALSGADSLKQEPPPLPSSTKKIEVSISADKKAPAAKPVEKATLSEKSGDPSRP
jgi:hypothetical protein